MPTQTSIKNHSQRNTIRVRYEDAVYEDQVLKDPKTGKPELDAKGHPVTRRVLIKWKPSDQQGAQAAPEKFTDAFVAHGQRRAILEELPT